MALVTNLKFADEITKSHFKVPRHSIGTAHCCMGSDFLLRHAESNL